MGDEKKQEIYGGTYPRYNLLNSMTSAIYSYTHCTNKLVSKLFATEIADEFQIKRQTKQLVKFLSLTHSCCKLEIIFSRDFPIHFNVFILVILIK